MSKPSTEFIILHETVLQSWIRDASVVALVFCTVGVGVLLDSSAMQWFGFIIALITVFSRSAIQLKNSPRLSFEDAHKRIDEIKAQYEAKQ